ncbi:MAG: hypothetical protein P8Z00_19855 [Anaerolineales bacterium]
MSKKERTFQPILDRRDFLKIMVLCGSTLAAASLLNLIDSESIESVLAISGTGPYYYGTDTSWAVDTKESNASNFPQNFYIGRTGAGTEIFNDSSFYPVAADKAGYLYTHTYWDLKGPYYKYIGSRTPYDYGHDQGTKAALAWATHYWYLKIGGRTIFADIERGKSNDPQSDLFDGWRYFSGGNEYVNIGKNRAVLEGFFDGVKDYIPQIYNPGIYTRTDLWQDWFGGADYDPHRAYVVWLAGNACSINCSPCGTCTTAKFEANSKFNAKKETAFGRYKTVVWQFYTSECPAPDCADYDIARQNGYIKFKPVYSFYLPFILDNGSENIGALSAYPVPGQESASIGDNFSTEDSPGAYPALETDQ